MCAAPADVDLPGRGPLDGAARDLQVAGAVEVGPAVLGHVEVVAGGDHDAGAEGGVAQQAAAVVFVVLVLSLFSLAAGKERRRSLLVPRCSFSLRGNRRGNV